MENNNIFKNSKIPEKDKKLSKIIKLRKNKNKENEIIIHKNNKKYNLSIINYIIKKLEKKEIFLLRTIFIIYIIIPIVAKNYIDKKRLLEENVDNFEIFIKVSEPGNQQILSSNFIYSKPNIYINGEMISISEDNKIVVEDSNYMITLKWDSPLTNCDLMFSGLSNIIEIDLSYFNPSYAESMKYMFHNCFNLTKK